MYEIRSTDKTFLENMRPPVVLSTHREGDAPTTCGRSINTSSPLHSCLDRNSIYHQHTSAKACLFRSGQVQEAKYKKNQSKFPLILWSCVSSCWRTLTACMLCNIGILLHFSLLLTAIWSNFPAQCDENTIQATHL